MDGLTTSTPAARTRARRLMTLASAGTGLLAASGTVALTLALAPAGTHTVSATTVATPDDGAATSTKGATPATAPTGSASSSSSTGAVATSGGS